MEKFKYGEGSIAVVTGGLGFIGSHMVELLVSKGYYVIIVDFAEDVDMSDYDHLDWPKESDKWEIHKEDVRSIHNIKMLNQIDIAFHFAAGISVQESMKDPLLYLETNVGGTIKVIDWLVDNGCKDLFIASTSAVYGDSDSTLESMKETHLSLCDGAKIKSVYGMSKFMMELSAVEYAKNVGLMSLSIGRFFNVYGPGQKLDSQYGAVIPIFIDNVIRSKNLVIHGDGSQTRDFIYVGDVVDKCYGLVQKSRHHKCDRLASNRVLNIGTGQATSIKDLASCILRKIDPNEMFGIEIEFVGDRENDIKHSVAEVRRLKDMFSINRTVGSISLELGLESTIQYFMRKMSKSY